MTEFLVGILSNIVSLVLVGLLVAAWYLGRRRLLLAFFGLRDERRVVIHPSRLMVQRSLGVDQLPRNFSSMATPEYETRIIADLTAFFEQFTPRILRLWGASPLLRWRDIDVSIEWPAAKDEIRRDCTIVVLGSPGYNLAAHALEVDFDAPVRFANDNRELATRDGVRAGGATSGALQRVKHRDTGQVAFYLAGPSAAATTAAANCLQRDWKRLAKRYRQREFYELVEATGGAGRQYTVVSPTSRR